MLVEHVVESREQKKAMALSFAPEEKLADARYEEVRGVHTKPNIGLEERGIAQETVWADEKDAAYYKVSELAATQEQPPSYKQTMTA